MTERANEGKRIKGPQMGPSGKDAHLAASVVYSFLPIGLPTCPKEDQMWSLDWWPGGWLFSCTAVQASGEWSLGEHKVPRLRLIAQESVPWSRTATMATSSSDVLSDFFLTFLKFNLNQPTHYSISLSTITHLTSFNFTLPEYEMLAIFCSLPKCAHSNDCPYCAT